MNIIMREKKDRHENSRIRVADRRQTKEKQDIDLRRRNSPNPHPPVKPDFLISLAATGPDITGMLRFEH